MQKTLLHTTNAVIGYAGKKMDTVIASDINISVKSGELVALVGANGIGKSTLLRTLTGIQPPLLGEIYIDNRVVRDFSAIELAQNLSVVLTEKLPPSNLTVYELVALGRQPYTNWMGNLSVDDKNAIKLAIELTQIGTLVNRKHFEISDGQFQKVLIARALAQQTDLLILDEPTTHLDLAHKASVLRLLTKLSRENSNGILFSTHDIELAIQLCDQIIVMTPEKVVQNTPEQLITDGIFENLFRDQDIYFDTVNRKFMLRDY